MIKFIKKLMYIVKHYDEFVAKTQQQLHQDMYSIYALQDALRSQGRIHVDAYRDHCKIVLLGEYKGHDLVEVVTLRDADFHMIVGVMDQYKLRGHLGKVDAPQDFRYVINREMR